MSISVLLILLAIKIFSMINYIFILIYLIIFAQLQKQGGVLTPPCELLFGFECLFYLVEKAAALFIVFIIVK